MKIKQNKLIVISLSLWAVVASAALVYYWNENQQLSTKNNSASSTKASESTNSENCQVSQNIQDFNDDGGSELVVFCDNQIRLSFSGRDSIYAGKTIEDINSFYDLFHFVSGTNKEPYEDQPTVKQVYTFPKTNPQFFAITSTYDSGGSWRTAFGIYQVNDFSIQQVFKRGFNDIPGRWNHVEFSESSTSFKIHITDWDRIELAPQSFYWNPSKQEFEKVN